MPLGSKVATLENSLRAKYGSNDHAIFGTLNKVGLMKGSRVTKKGRQASKSRLRKAKGPSTAALTLNKLGMGF